MFLHLCVILFTVFEGGVGFPECITGHMTGGVCIQGERGWADTSPPRYMGYYGIRSTSDRYASYWNAFLVNVKMIYKYAWDDVVPSIIDFNFRLKYLKK